MVLVHSCSCGSFIELLNDIGCEACFLPVPFDFIGFDLTLQVTRNCLWTYRVVLVWVINITPVNLLCVRVRLRPKLLDCQSVDFGPRSRRPL